ncbi:MAG: hypothetical protein WDA16_01455, partial [Candidatus Thermoplasmatota archaeon]
MNARKLRTVALMLGAIGLVGWYTPAGAFNYAHMPTAGGRSVSAAVVNDKTAFVAPSTATCTLPKATGGTCKVYVYNNATAKMTISFSLQANTLGGSYTWTVDSVNSGTTRTSAAKSLGEWAFFNLTWGVTPCILGCTYTSNWQINGTSSTSNVLWTHQDAYVLTTTF